MRVYSVIGFVLACSALSACGKPVAETEVVANLPAPEKEARVSDPVSKSAGAPRKTPGQPRLSELTRRANATSVKSEVAEAQDSAEDEAPAALATFTQYDGRDPTDAIVPRSVPETDSEPTVNRWESIVSRNKTEQAKVSAKDPEPEAPATATRATQPVRDKAPTVLAAATPRQVQPRQPSRTVRATPRPVPRPVTASPRPARRPATEVAAVAPVVEPVRVAALPARPSIRALSLPSLAAPLGSQDGAPTGLPTPSSTEVAFPLGTVPASLGVANLQCGEAAAPVADSLEQSKADDSGALGWDDAAALLRAGEVESAVDIGEFEVLMTLCSGRGVLTIQPTPGALAAINFPKVVCGKTASLTSQ